MDSPVKQRFDEADFLRGIAAAGVVVYHFLYGFVPAHRAPAGIDISLITIDPPMLPALINGPFMVSVFFVLSSFVLTSTLVQNADNARAFTGILKRFPRLLPLTMVGTFLPAALYLSGLMFNSEAADLTGSIWLERSGGVKFWEPWPQPAWAGAALDSVHLFMRGLSQYNSALWTMKYELVGSIMALICALFIGSRAKLLTDGLISLLLAYVALKVHPLCAICVATVYLTKYLLPLVATLDRSWGWVFIGCGILLGSTYKSFPEDWLVHDWAARQILRADWFIHGLGALLLLMGVQALKLFGVYRSRAARFLARHSFAMYVLHVPIQGSVASFVLIALGHNWLGVSAGFVMSTALLGILVLPVSRLDEAWVAKLNKLFAQRNWRRGRIRPI